MVDLIENQNEPKPVKDKYYLTYVLFYFLGTTAVIFSNFFTTATDYWNYKFRDPEMPDYNTNNKTSLQTAFASNYTIVTSVSHVLSMILAVILAKKGIDAKQRIIIGLSGACLMFDLTCILSKVDTDSWQMGLFVITLITGFILTGSCTLLLVTIFVMVAKFPQRYFGALLSGQSLCGILAALVQIFSLSVGTSPTTKGLTYFAIGFGFVLTTLLCDLVMLKKSEFFKHYMKLQTEDNMEAKYSKEIFIGILKKLKFYLSSIVIVMGSTTMIHPGLTSLVVSVDKGNGNEWNDIYFVPVITYLLYNICDYIGRELALFLKKPKNDLVIFIISILRISLIPLLMFCNAHPREHLPVTFDQDFIYIIFIMMLAFSNGYLVNTCAVSMTSIITEEERKICMIVFMGFMFLASAGFSFLNAALINAL